MKTRMSMNRIIDPGVTDDKRENAQPASARASRLIWTTKKFKPGDVISWCLTDEKTGRIWHSSRVTHISGVPDAKGEQCYEVVPVGDSVVPQG